MSKYMRYLLRAFALAALLANKIPQYLADGKITIEELVDLAKNVLEIGGWKADITVPDSWKDAAVDFTLLDE